MLKKGANNTISFHVKIFIFADIIRRYNILNYVLYNWVLCIIHYILYLKM